jgi:GT2 family glycosyltransferase
MENYDREGIRGALPESARACYRSLRAWLLSVNLPARGTFSLSGEERRASGRMSVVVAVHDVPEVTQRCLRSLEVFGGEAEVIVVDDGSKLEATKLVVEKACSRNRWKLLRHDTALGHSRASEAGVAASTRPYVCLLNSDTVVTPRSWRGIDQAFASSAEIAVVGPSTSQTPTPQCVRRALHCRHYWSDEQVWCFAEKHAARHQGEPVVDLPMAGGFAFFVRRSVWDKLGGFDKTLPDYGNETEFCYRLRRAGFRIVWTKGSYIHHLGSESYGRTVGFGEIRRRCVEATAYIQQRQP